MYDELVKRLKDAAKMSEALAVLLPHSEGNATAKLFNEAADTIEELNAICDEQKAQIILMAAEIEEQQDSRRQEATPTRSNADKFREQGAYSSYEDRDECDIFVTSYHSMSEKELAEWLATAIARRHDPEATVQELEKGLWLDWLSQEARDDKP